MRQSITFSLGYHNQISCKTIMVHSLICVFFKSVRKETVF
jgi:hypothetical protein